MNSHCKENFICCGHKKTEKDAFEQCYTLTSGLTVSGVIWSADGVMNPCGTLFLKINRIDTPGATIFIFINGNVVTPVANLGEGDFILMTSDPLTEIEVAASLNNVTYDLTLCLTIDYECC